MAAKQLRQQFVCNDATRSWSLPSESDESDESDEGSEAAEATAATEARVQVATLTSLS